MNHLGVTFITSGKTMTICGSFNDIVDEKI